jgi:hypothetical protein
VTRARAPPGKSRSRENGHALSHSRRAPVVIRPARGPSLRAAKAAGLSPLSASPSFPRTRPKGSRGSRTSNRKPGRTPTIGAHGGENPGRESTRAPAGSTCVLRVWERTRTSTAFRPISEMDAAGRRSGRLRRLLSAPGRRQSAGRADSNRTSTPDGWSSPDPSWSFSFLLGVENISACLLDGPTLRPSGPAEQAAAACVRFFLVFSMPQRAPGSSPSRGDARRPVPIRGGFRRPGWAQCLLVRSAFGAGIPVNYC